MNWPLLKENLRSIWKLLAVFLAVIGLYVAVIVVMYDPEMSATLEAFTQVMPEMMAAFGMGNVGTTLAAFLSNYLYGFLLLVFPLVFAVLSANRLITRRVDQGSMAWLLASPNPRGRVARTQAFTLLLSIVILVAFSMVMAVVLSAVFFPGELDTAAYLRLNMGLLCTQLAVSGIAYLAACLCNESKNAVAIGAGIPVVFFLVQMLVNLGGKLENLKYMTIFTLFDTVGLLSGERNALFAAGILGVLGIGLYIVGNGVFRRRNLPL